MEKFPWCLSSPNEVITMLKHDNKEQNKTKHEPPCSTIHHGHLMFHPSLLNCLKNDLSHGLSHGTYHIGDQRRLRPTCASAQSRQSLCSSHTWSMELVEGSDQTSDILDPLGGCACAFEESVYGGRRVPYSHEIISMEITWYPWLCHLSAIFKLFIWSTWNFRCPWIHKATPNEPRHEKTCVSHMRTTKVQISLCIRAVWSAPLLFAA